MKQLIEAEITFDAFSDLITMEQNLSGVLAEFVVVQAEADNENRIINLLVEVQSQENLQ